MSKRLRNALNSNTALTNPTNAQTSGGLGYADGLDKNSAMRVMQSSEYLQDVADYYFERDGKTFSSTGEMLDYAKSDRRWRNMNTISIGMDLYDANTQSDQQNLRQARIQAVFDAMPAFYEEGGDGWAGFGTNALAAIADPINLIGFGAGGAAAKVAATQGAKSALKQGLGREAAKKAGKSAGLKAGIKSGAKGEALAGGLVEGIHDQGIQRRDVALGLQDEVSYGRTAGAVAAGAALGGALGGVFGAAGAANPIRSGMRSNMEEGAIRGMQEFRADRAAEAEAVRLEAEAGVEPLPERNTPEERQVLSQRIKARTKQMDDEFIETLDEGLAARGDAFDLEEDLFDVELDDNGLTQGQRINQVVDRMNDLDTAASALTKQADDAAAKGDAESAAELRSEAAKHTAAATKIGNQLRRIDSSTETTTDEMITEAVTEAANTDPLLLTYNPDAPKMSQLPDGSPVRDLDGDEQLRKRAIMPEVKQEGQELRPTAEQRAAEAEALGTTEVENAVISTTDTQPRAEVAEETPEAARELTEIEQAQTKYDDGNARLQEKRESYRQLKENFVAAKKSGRPAAELAQMRRQIIDAEKEGMELKRYVDEAEKELSVANERARIAEGSQSVEQNVDAEEAALGGAATEDMGTTPESVAATMEVTNPAILEQLGAFYELGLAQPKKYYERLLKKLGDGRKPEVKAARRELLLQELQRAVSSYQLITEVEASIASDPNNLFQLEYHRANIELMSDDPQIVTYLQDFYTRMVRQNAKSLFAERFSVMSYAEAMESIRTDFGKDVAGIIEEQISPEGQAIGTPEQWSAIAKKFFSQVGKERADKFKSREGRIIKHLMDVEGFSETKARELARIRMETVIDKTMRANDPLKTDTRTLTDFSVSDENAENAAFMGAARRQGAGEYTVFGKTVKGGEAMKKAQRMLQMANRHGFTGQLLQAGVKITPDGRFNQISAELNSLTEIYQARVDVATNRLVTDSVLAERNAVELQPIEEAMSGIKKVRNQIKRQQKKLDEAGGADEAIEAKIAELNQQEQQLIDSSRPLVDKVFLDQVDGDVAKALGKKRLSLVQNTEKGAAGNRMEEALKDADAQIIRSEINALRKQINRAVNTYNNTGRLGVSEERMEEMMSDMTRLRERLEKGGKGKAVRKRMKENLRKEKIARAALRGEETPKTDIHGEITPEETAMGQALAREMQRKAAAEAKYSQRISDADLNNMTKAELIEFIQTNKATLDKEIGATAEPDVAPASLKHKPAIVVSKRGIEVDVNNDFEYRKINDDVFEVYYNGQKLGTAEKTMNGGIFYKDGNGAHAFTRGAEFKTGLVDMYDDMISGTQKRTGQYDEVAPAQVTYDQPDWRHSESYKDEAAVPASEKTDPIEDPAPVSDPDNMLTWTEKNFDVPAGRKLAIQIVDGEAGKQNGAVRVLSYKTPQTVGKVLGKSARFNYVVGTVEHGMTSSKMGARETFRPLNADDAFIPVNGAQPVKNPTAAETASRRLRKNKPAKVEDLQGKKLTNPPQWAVNDGLITAADLYGYVENLDNIPWNRINTVEDYRRFMQIRAEAGMLLNQYAPNGVARPVADVKNSVTSLARVLQGRADDELQAAQDFIVRLAGHNRNKAPIFTHSEGDSMMLGMGNAPTIDSNRITIGEKSLMMDENGQRHIPVTATIIHEMGHWIYANLLDEADKMRFWDAMGKFYGDETVNVQMLRDRGSLDGVATNDLESPAEFFANQFMAWSVNTGQVNNLSLWKKVARMASTLMRKLMGDDAVEIDEDLIPIFQKYMPTLNVDPETGVDNGGISKFAHLESLGKEHGKSGGNTAALAGKQLNDLDVMRHRIRTVLNTSTYETADALNLVQELQNSGREIYGSYGHKQGAKKHPNPKGKDGQGSTRVRLLDGTFELDKLMKAQFAIHDYLRNLKLAGAVRSTKSGVVGNLEIDAASRTKISELIGEQEVEFEGFSSWDAQMAQMLENNSSLNNLETQAVMHLHKLGNELLFAIDGAMEKYAQIYKRNMKKTAKQEGILVDTFDGTISMTKPSKKSLFYMRKAREQAAKELEEYFDIQGVIRTANTTRFTDADASPNPELKDAPSAMSSESLAAEAKATTDDVKRVADIGNELQNRNNVEPQSVDELIEGLDETGRLIYEGMVDEESARRVLTMAMQMTASPETAQMGRNFMQIATKVLHDMDVKNPAPVKNNKVKEAVKRVAEKEVGTDSQNGILHGSASHLKEHAGAMTHRDKRTEYVMRMMFQRMAELQGIDDSTPLSEYEATIMLGADPRGAADDSPIRTDSEIYNNLRDHMRDLAQRARNGDFSVFEDLADMTYYGLSESERKVIERAVSYKGGQPREGFQDMVRSFMADGYIPLPEDTMNAATVRKLVQKAGEEVVFVLNKLSDSQAFKSQAQYMAYGDMFADLRNKAPNIAAADSVNRRSVTPVLATKYAAELPTRMSDRVRTAVREFLGLTPQDDISKHVYFSKSDYNEIDAVDGDYGNGVYVSRGDDLAKSYDPVEFKAEMMQKLDDSGVTGNVRNGAIDTINMLVAIKDRISRASINSRTQRLVMQDLLRMEDRQWRILRSISGAFTHDKVMPVFANVSNSFDFSKKGRYTIVGNQRNNVEYIIDSLGAEGLIDPEGVRYIRGVLTDEFTGEDLYRVLTDEEVGIMHKRGSSADSVDAKEKLNAHLSGNGFDAIETNDGFMLLNENSVRHVKDGYTEFDTQNHARTYVGNELTPLGSMAEEMAVTNEPLPKGMGVGVIAQAQLLGVPDAMTKPMRKMMRGERLNDKDVDRASIFSTVANWFKENSNYFRSIGASYIGDKLKPKNGFGIFEKHDVELNNVLAPLFAELNGLPDNRSGFNRWARRNEGLLFRDIRQPASHRRIIEALREGRFAVQRLEPQERLVALKIAKAFEEELVRMRELGIVVGDTRNYGLDYYVPQVWDKEAILSNPNKFQRALKQYFLREQSKPDFDGNIKGEEDIDQLVKKVFNKMTKEDGVLDSVDQAFSALRNSPFQRRMLRLTPGDVPEMNEFLVNDLSGILAKYFDRTVRKRALVQEFGISGHGLTTYKEMIRAEDPIEAAAYILRTDKKVESVNNTLQGVVSVENLSIPRLDNNAEEIKTLLKDVKRTVRSGPSGKAKAKAILINAIQPSDRNNPQYLVRVEAIVNALNDFPDGGASHVIVDKINNIDNVLNKRPIDGTSGTETQHKFVRNLKAFNSVSLLGFTTLTSIPDLALPLIRSGNMAAFSRAWKNYMTDPTYRQSAKNIGVGIENLLHDRMVQMGGEGSQKFTNAFFNFTLLTPWTNFNREIAAMVGYEAFRAEVARAVRMQNSGQVNSRAYKTAYRFLERYGLTGPNADYDFLKRGAYAIDNIPKTDDTINDQLKAAILRFTNESIFTPNPNDVPMWAQTPWGSLMFQLKSFPLMMSRLSADVIREAGKGNVMPLTYMLTAGVGLGMLSIGVKDVVQSRGGEDGESRAFRERAASKLIPVEEGGDYDERLGWYLEGLMAMGGLGLFAELFYNSAAQLDNGKYGFVRTMSSVFGPSVSAAETAFDISAGAADAAFGDPDKNSKERQALRQVAGRIPIAGGVNAFRESAADLAGPAKKRKSSKFNAKFGTNSFGTGKFN